MTQITQITPSNSFIPQEFDSSLESLEEAVKPPRKTCANCPDRETCTALCLDMERYLNCGNTTAHKSVGDCGMFDWVPNVFAHPGATPEMGMVGGEISSEVTDRLLRYIDGFAAKVSKGDTRKKAMLENMLTYVYLENYSHARAAEILGETYEEFRGKEMIERTNGYAPIQKQKGSRQCLRICNQFGEFCARTHLKEKIHEVLTTGSMDRVNCL